MSDIHDSRSTSPAGGPHHPGSLQRSDSSASSAMTSSDGNETTIHQPIPTRPRLPSRKSSGPLVVPRDSSAVGPVESEFGPDDVRAMSPRRTSEDIDRMGKAAREEMRSSVDVLSPPFILLLLTFAYAGMPERSKSRLSPSSTASKPSEKSTTSSTTTTDSCKSTLAT